MSKKRGGHSAAASSEDGFPASVRLVRKGILEAFAQFGSLEEFCILARWLSPVFLESASIGREIHAVKPTRTASAVILKVLLTHKPGYVNEYVLKRSLRDAGFKGKPSLFILRLKKTRWLRESGLVVETAPRNSAEKGYRIVPFRTTLH